MWINVYTPVTVAKRRLIKPPLKSIRHCRCGKEAIIGVKLRATLKAGHGFLQNLQCHFCFLKTFIALTFTAASFSQRCLAPGHLKSSCCRRRSTTHSLPSPILLARHSSRLFLVSSLVANNNHNLWTVHHLASGVIDLRLCIS